MRENLIGFAKVITWKVNGRLKHTPIIIYQMGKVGSTSIYKSLKSQYPGVVFHGHSFGSQHYDARIRFLYHWAINNKKPIFIISPTREPIGRNISAYFENFERQMKQKFTNNNFTLTEVVENFFSTYDHTIPLTWFDRHIFNNFGIDVYKQPFSINDGYSTYKHNNINLLVLHIELSDEKKEHVIKEFLSLQEFDLKNDNVATNKEYNSLYNDFKNSAKIPLEYINSMTSSKYFMHFYGEEAMHKANKKWSRQ